MTRQSFSLRPAEPRDAEDIANLFTQLGHPTDALDVPARLVEVVDTGGSVILAVDDRGKALGLASLARVRVIHAAGAVAYITGFIITAESRGQGIGRALVAAAMDWAKRERCVRITVTSGEHRADAHAFYAKCGLPFTGRRFSAVLDAPEGQS